MKFILASSKRSVFEYISLRSIKNTLSTFMKAIFDTNSVYYLEDKLSEDDFQKLVVKVNEGQLKVFVSPITVIEMASRLEEAPNDFSKVQKAIQKLFKLKPIFLPDPEQQLAEYISNSATDIKKYSHWEKIFYAIKIAPNLDQLKKGFNDYSTFIKMSVNITNIHSLRSNYENNYVSDMENVLKSIVPSFNKKIQKGKNTRLDKSKIPDFKKFLELGSWNNLVKVMLVNRTLLELPTNEIKLNEIFKKIYFFKKSYEDLFIKIFEQGYIPNIKKKNDYNDWHFNVYFNDSNNYIFVTSEKNTVFNELRAKNRVIDIIGLL